MNRFAIAAFISLFITQESIGDDSIVNKKRKPKEDYKYSKCVDIYIYHQAELSQEEICQYSISCPSKPPKKRANMFCTEENISECFINKSWKSANQLVGIPENQKIGSFSRSMTAKAGEISGKSCAYYD